MHDTIVSNTGIRLNNLDFDTLEQAMHFGSLAYAMSALTRRHRVDYAGNKQHGLCESNSFFQNVKGHLHLAKTANAQANYWHNTQDISGIKNSTIDLDDINIMDPENCTSE